MRRQFITASPDDSLAEVRQTMRLARLRHLIVERDGFLVGIVSYRDVLEDTLAQLGVDGTGCLDLSVERAMVPEPECVSIERSLGDVAALLWRTGKGCLPVVEPTEKGPRLVGLVTETDLLRAAYDPLHPRS